MTAKEAIDTLKCPTNFYCEDYLKALDMAIDALTEQTQQKTIVYFDIRGCDDTTQMLMEATEKELNFLKKIGDYSTALSAYSCMPDIRNIHVLEEIEEKEIRGVCYELKYIGSNLSQIKSEISDLILKLNTRANEKIKEQENG